MIKKFKTITNLAVFKDFNWDNAVIDKQVLFQINIAIQSLRLNLKTDRLLIKIIMRTLIMI